MNIEEAFAMNKLLYSSEGFSEKNSMINRLVNQLRSKVKESLPQKLQNQNELNNGIY